MHVLTPEERAFFEENGYIVVPNAVPQENLDAVVEAIFEFLGMDPDDPEDWYREPLRKGGMVEMYHHPAMWDNRQHPRVHQIFSDLWGTEELWVTIDRVNLKPPRHPEHPDWDHKGFIHWDTDTTELPVPFGVQGVLYLTDTDADQGGFQCVPGMHRFLEEWVKTQPPDRNPRVPDLTGLEVRQVPGKAGDLVIWHKALAHGNGHNVSDKPRLAQYISMFPVSRRSEEARQHRIHLWKNRLCPGGPAFPGDPRRIEELQGETAELTLLGRKLLGLDRWDL